MQGDRLIKIAVREQFKEGFEGSMFMDLPENLSYNDIANISQNRKLWKQLSITLGYTNIMQQCINDSGHQPTTDPITPAKADATTPSTPTTPNGNNNHTHDIGRTHVYPRHM